MVIIFVQQNNEIPIMTEKFRKIDRPYVLSDSSVNEYGFRLLTEGYQLGMYQKNPIGYYMHRREDGIAVKWEDLRIEGDQVVGVPVINLSHSRGEQICDEVENGFLNAASVGHIVVLEYSTDPEMQLPGQTGPTITKWYNKEYSLVDIPGNGNALTCLYDAQEQKINLMDLNVALPLMQTKHVDAIKELCGALNMADTTDGRTLVAAVQDLMTKTTALAADNQTLATQVAELNQQIREQAAANAKYETNQLLEEALAARKLTVAMKNQLAADYGTNAAGLRLLLAAMPAYRSITELLQTKQAEAEELQWTWDDYERNDPKGNKLRELKASNPERYRALFDRKFETGS